MVSVVSQTIRPQVAGPRRDGSPERLSPTSLPRSPDLCDQRAEARVERGNVDRADPSDTQASAATATAGAGARARLAKARHRNGPGDMKAAGEQLGAHREAIVHRQIGEAGLAMTRAILHHGGAEVARREPPSLREVG